MEIRDHNPINIFYADDDDDDRELFKSALNDACITSKLSTFEDGCQLMQHLAEMNQNHPDVIFLDINMPYKNGKCCLKEIRSNHQLNEVPVVMFTTASDQKDIEETFAGGANLYVSKPVS